MELIAYLNHLLLKGSFVSLLGAFGGGIVASFTPCIYPVLPIVVSFLGHQSSKSDGRRIIKPAISYFSGLSLTYGFLGVVAVFSGKVFGFWAGNKWLYVLVGNICLLSGFVMLEWIKIPEFLKRLASLYTSNGEKRWGAFIMGATSALVVGPCTTPILGTVISVATTSDSMLQSFLVIMGFSFGIGFPILVLGTFTGFLAYLPKSGPWLIGVQKFCGVGMLILAEYFLVRAGIFW